MSHKRTTGLGRGFDALLPENFDTSLLTSDEERVHRILIQDITPNKDQPRRHFDEETLAELAVSIKQYGILQPLIVTPLDEKTYQIVAGERRWRAAQLAKLEHLPAIIRTSEELEQLEIALVENVQRVDLSPLEQAASIRRLHDQFNMDYENIAKRLGKATTTVQNIVRLLQLSPEAREALHKKRITEGHARAILALKNPKKQIELLNLIEQKNWSVRETERYVTAQKAGIKNPKAATARVASTTPETEKLSRLLKTKVSLRRMAKGGNIEIGFKHDAELARIIKRLSQG